MDFSAEGILDRMKGSLKNADTRIEGSFSMDNLHAVSEELARFDAMRIAPLINMLADREEDMGTSGNERHYRRWANEAVDAEGRKIVGNAKVDAPRDGTGFVSIAILTTEAEPPSEEQVRTVQEYINSMRPVGADPVVSAAEGIPVTIVCTVRKKPGFTEETVRGQIKGRIKRHFTETAFQSENAALNYYTVSSIICGTDGVREMRSLKVNNGQESITAEYNKYFALEELVINVIE